MKSRPKSMLSLMFLLVSILVLAVLIQDAYSRSGPKDLTKKRLKLKGYPRPYWRESFNDNIRGVHLAFKSGDVLVNTNQYVWLYDCSGKLVWKQGKGRGWKYIAGAGISDTGDKTIFEVNQEKKVATNMLDLDIYYLDREGNLLWTKDNPYRYNMTQLSPTGSYIVFGDPMEKQIKIYDANLNLLWTKELYLWYISFDPKEHFLFDAVEGLLFNLEGRQVWDVGGLSRILSVSDEAEVMLTQKFLGRKGTDEMYLIDRTAIKKVVLQGRGGCVSPDGSMVAIVTPDKKLKIYRTKELLTTSVEELPPIFQCDYFEPKFMNFSRDNMTLLAFGKQSIYQRELILIGLNQNKILWKESLPDTVKEVLTTQNNRYILTKQDPTTIQMYLGY